MKIILVLCIFSTSLMSYAEQAYVADQVSCENGNAVNSEVSTQLSTEIVKYILKQAGSAVVLEKIQTSNEGVEIRETYELTKHGELNGKNTYIAHSQDTKEVFFVLGSVENSVESSSIVSIYDTDDGRKACNGGMVLTSLVSTSVSQSIAL